MTNPQTVERFRDAIVRNLGLSFDEGRLGFLAEVMQRRLDQNGISAEAYLEAFERRPNNAENAQLAEALTVCETYFFRNNDQFRALAEVVIPQRMRVNSASRRLRILSAGCASGEEPYTLAIVLRTLVDPSWQVTIRAVDANPAALKKARAARYSTWSLRDTPMEIQQQWFRASGRDAVLDESIRSAVTFDERNLAADDPELWHPESYDVVFCRNVLMYFAPDKARAAIARMARSLVPGGYFFFGHAETMRGLSNEFHLRHSHDAFYYQRRESSDDGDVDLDISSLPVRAPTYYPPVVDDSWMGAINRASDRVTALTQKLAFDTAAAPPPPKPSWNLSSALDLLQRERFAEALVLIDGLPSESGTDPDVLLLQAVLLAHSGQARQAGETASRLLAIDEMNAGANYVIALCFEEAGDRTTAANHYRVAIYLDPTFAMPRLHLGILLRRAGDHPAAARELKEALVLLQREDASRLLLFGSGFTRDALITLCQSEFARCTPKH